MKSSLRGVVALAVFLAIGPGLLFGQTLAELDQYNLTGAVTAVTHSITPMGQWFTVGRPGRLVAVELCLSTTAGTTQPLVFEIRDFGGGLPGITIETLTLTPADLAPMVNHLVLDQVTGTLIDLSHLEIDVAIGDQIGFWMATTELSPDGYIYRIISGNPYPNGEYITTTGAVADVDVVFKTFVAGPIFSDGFETGDTSAWSNGEIAFVTTTPYYSATDISWLGRVFCQSGDCPWDPPDQLHDGIDFMPVADLVPFRSACDGTVSWVDLFFNTGNGLYQGNVLIECSADPTGGLIYAFEPMSPDINVGNLQIANITVTDGDPVAAGDLIGNLVISEPGSHLHWGVVSDFTQVCPVPHLTPAVAADLLTLIRRDHPTWEICH